MKKYNVFYETTNDKGYKMIRQMDNGHTVVITSAWGHDRANTAIQRYNDGEITRRGLQRILWSLVGGILSENKSKGFETERDAYNYIYNKITR